MGLFRDFVDHFLDPAGATSARDRFVTDTTGINLGATDLIPGIKDNPGEISGLTSSLTAEARLGDAKIPLPEEAPSKRKRAARLRGKRRGRTSTILSINDEPLGGL